MSIKINVGGTIFETSENTLKKINYFKYLFDDTNITNNDIPFVDRPAHIFKHVLALAIDNTYKYPIKYKNELDFYDVTCNANNLYDPKIPIIECEQNMKRKMEKIYDNLKYKIDELNSEISNLKNNVENINNNNNNNNNCTEKYCKWHDCYNDPILNDYCRDHICVCNYENYRYGNTTYCENNGKNFIDGNYRCDEHNY